MSAPLVNGKTTWNDSERPNEDASSQRITPPYFDLEVALSAISRASLKKQAPRMFRAAFLGAVDELMDACIKKGQNLAREEVMRFLLGQALLYYERAKTWEQSDRRFVKRPKEFFSDGTYREDAAIMWRHREDVPSKWESQVAPEYAAQIDDQHTEILLQRALSQSAPPSDQHSPLTERPALICLADVEAREVDWLWNSYIPIGMLSMISGDPGVGKSYIAMSIAAELSRGRSLDGRNIEPGTTLYLTRENPIAESIRPRFDMLGGDAERLILLEGKSISTDVREEMILIELGDVNTLASALQETKARLMIVYPIQSYLGAQVDFHRANETRPIMDRLTELAEKYRCAILLLRHLSKQTGGKPIHRGLGSVDLTGSVRSEMLAGSLRDDPSSRAFIHIKSNVGLPGRSLSYAIAPAGRFAWTGETATTAEELLAAPDGSRNQKMAEAKQWLTDQLRSESCEQKEIRELAERAGISYATLRRAKNELGVQSEKVGMNGSWRWSLPEDAHEDVQTKNMSTFAEHEHLRTCSNSTKKLNISSLDLEGAQQESVSTLVNTFEKNGHHVPGDPKGTAEETCEDRAGDDEARNGANGARQRSRAKPFADLFRASPTAVPGTG